MMVAIIDGVALWIGEGESVDAGGCLCLRREYFSIPTRGREGTEEWEGGAVRQRMNQWTG